MYLVGDRLRPAVEIVCRNVMDWLLFEVECMVQTSVMFGERVVVDPDWDQDLSRDIVDYLLNSNPLPDPCRMAVPRKPFVMPVMIANTSVKLIKQEVKDFVLTTVIAHGEAQIGIDEIRGHIKLVFNRNFAHRDTVLNRIIDEAIRELNEYETDSDEEGLSTRSAVPGVAPPSSPPLVRIQVMDPAHDTENGRKIVGLLKEIFEEGTGITDVQVMQQLQATVDLSAFLKQLEDLDLSFTDLIAFYRRAALEAADNEEQALKRSTHYLPALISGTDITDLMLTPDEQKKCEELTKLVKLFPDDSLEQATGVSRIEVAEELIETYNSQVFATESLFIKAVIKKLFKSGLEAKKMDAVTAKCLPRFLLKAWRLLQRDEAHRLKARDKTFSTNKRVRIKREPEEETQLDDSTIIIDLTDDQKFKKKGKKRKKTVPATAAKKTKSEPSHTIARESVEPPVKEIEETPQEPTPGQGQPATADPGRKRPSKPTGTHC